LVPEDLFCSDALKLALPKPGNAFIELDLGLSQLIAADFDVFE